MADHKDLLIELGTEELPPKALDRLSSAFMAGIEQQLVQHGLGFSNIQRYASPRRLALLIDDLAIAQHDRVIERRGPAVAAAFDANGNPTKAVEGFARSCGVAVSQLEQIDTPKGAWLVHKQLQAGKPTAELIPEMVEKALAGLPIPKRMRWGSREEEFVRPVHWLVLLFGNEAVQGSVLGLDAGRTTRGHRFLHPEPIEIGAPAEYPELLRNTGQVIADPAERRALIRSQVEAAAAGEGAQAVIEEELLDEVTALVEYPVAVMGAFDERFLTVPAEALIKTMQGHQKYFPVVDSEGQLLPRFITISNIPSRNPAAVRAGNERVIRPRFSDAAFFWEQDLKHPLQDHIEGLKTVVFQEKLGTLHDKAERVSRLAQRIAEELDFDPQLAQRAAQLSKCDLLTLMVGEFPELQGTMGRYYATHAGEAPDVAAAMEEQYLPRHAGDRLPLTYCGRALAIADRLDTLVGIFAIGQRPSGEKDPFGLRRAALGVLRTMIETPLDLDLESLLQCAAKGFAGRLDAVAATDEVFSYMMERLRAYYSERGIAADEVDAVLAQRPTRPADFDLRVRAVTAFRKRPEAESLAAANKRIRNILRKTEETYPQHPDINLLREASEKALASQLAELSPVVEPLFSQGRYSEALQLLAGLRDAVDTFFDGVMVMCEDEALRKNRLALLASLSELFLRVADLSRLQ